MDNSHVEPQQKQSASQEVASLTDVRMLIGGMGCPNCAARVRTSLLGLPGVVEAVIDHHSGVGRVFYNLGMVTDHELERAVRAAGDGQHEYLGKLVSVAS